MGILRRFFGNCIGFDERTQAEGSGSRLHAQSSKFSKAAGVAPRHDQELFYQLLQQKGCALPSQHEAVPDVGSFADLLGGNDPVVLLEFVAVEEALQLQGHSLLERFRASGRLLLNINFCGMLQSDVLDSYGQQLHAAYGNCQAVRLYPRFANSALRNLLRCPTPDVYEALLAELLSSEPLLRAAIKDSCIALVEGTAAAAGSGGAGACSSTAAYPIVVHHPLPGSGSKILLPVTVQPVIVRRHHGIPRGCAGPSEHKGAKAAAGAAHLERYDLLAAVVLRYSLSSGICVMHEQLHRCLTALSGLPSSVTLLSADSSRVMYQNTASVRYMGLRQGLTAAPPAGRSAIFSEPVIPHSADLGDGGDGIEPGGLQGGGAVAPGGCDSRYTGRHPRLRYGIAAWEEKEKAEEDAACAAGDTLGGGLGSGVLAELFSLSPQQWRQVLIELASRRSWQGIVRVPRLLTRQAAPERGVTVGQAAMGSSAVVGSTMGRETEITAAAACGGAAASETAGATGAVSQVLDCVASWDCLTVLKPQQPAPGQPPPRSRRAAALPPPLVLAQQSTAPSLEAAAVAASSPLFFCGAAGGMPPLAALAPGSVGAGAAALSKAAFRHISAPGVPLWTAASSAAAWTAAHPPPGQGEARVAAAATGAAMSLISPTREQACPQRQPQLPPAVGDLAGAIAGVGAGAVRTCMPAVPEAAAAAASGEGGGESLLTVLLRQQESIAVPNASGSHVLPVPAGMCHSNEPLDSIEHDGGSISSMWNVGGFALPQRPPAPGRTAADGGANTIVCYPSTSPTPGGGGGSGAGSRCFRCVGRGGGGELSSDVACAGTGTVGCEMVAVAAEPGPGPGPASAAASRQGATATGMRGGTPAVVSATTDLEFAAARARSLDIYGSFLSSKLPCASRPARTSFGLTPFPATADDSRVLAPGPPGRGHTGPTRSAGGSHRGPSRGDPSHRRSRDSQPVMAIPITRGSSCGGPPASGSSPGGGGGGGISPTGRMMSQSLRQSIELRRNALGLMGRSAASGAPADNPLSTSTWALVAQGDCGGAGGNTLKRHTSFGAAVLRAGGHPQQARQQQQQLLHQKQLPQQLLLQTQLPHPQQQQQQTQTQVVLGGSRAAAPRASRTSTGLLPPSLDIGRARPTSSASPQSFNADSGCVVGRPEKHPEGPISASMLQRTRKSAPPLFDSERLAEAEADGRGDIAVEAAVERSGGGGGGGGGWPSRMATAAAAAFMAAAAGVIGSGVVADSGQSGRVVKETDGSVASSLPSQGAVPAATASTGGEISTRWTQSVDTSNDERPLPVTRRRGPGDSSRGGAAPSPPREARSGLLRGLAVAGAAADGPHPAGPSSRRLARTISTAPSASTSASTLAPPPAPLPLSTSVSASTSARSRLWLRSPLRSRTLSPGGHAAVAPPPPAQQQLQQQQQLAVHTDEADEDISFPKGRNHRLFPYPRRSGTVQLSGASAARLVEDAGAGYGTEQGEAEALEEELALAGLAGCGGGTATTTVDEEEEEEDEVGEDLMVADSATVDVVEMPKLAIEAAAERAEEEGCVEATLGGGGCARSCGHGDRDAAAGVGADAGADVEEEGSEEGCCWHEVTLTLMDDEGSSSMPMILLVQTDVTDRVRAERSIARMLEAEHQLLESIFPRHVLELAAATARRSGARAKAGPARYRLAQLPLPRNSASTATYHPMVTVLFADIKGFTNLCHQIPATQVMEFLNNLYSRLDTLLDVYGVYKVETIGDCYMVAGGLMARDADGFMSVRGPGSVDELHAAKTMAFAKAMLREASHVLLPTTQRPVEMRIGLHSGPCMSGIVGSKMPRFCLFGDTVNTASRMESTCTPGCIHVSATTRALLPDEEWEPTGGVQVKGIGVMDTFRWRGGFDDDCINLGLGLGLGADALPIAAFAGCGHGIKRSSAGALRTRARRASAAVILSSGAVVSACAATAPGTCATARPARATGSLTSTVQRTPAAASPLLTLSTPASDSRPCVEIVMSGAAVPSGSVMLGGSPNSAFAAATTEAAAAAAAAAAAHQHPSQQQNGGALVQQRMHGGGGAGGTAVSGSGVGIVDEAAGGELMCSGRRAARGRQLRRSCSSLAVMGRRLASGSSAGTKLEELVLLRRELSQMPVAARPPAGPADRVVAQAAMAAAMESAEL